MNWAKHNKVIGTPWAVIWNILLLYVAYGVTRLAFFLENRSVYEHLSGFGDVWSILCGGLYFDTSAICYTNALYLLLVFFPCHLKENSTYQHFCKWLYLVVNGLALATNLCDAVYYQYTARRTTIAFFNEFGADDKLGSIVGYEFLRHWYLVLLFLMLMVVLYKCCLSPIVSARPLRRYYLSQVVALLVASFLCWGGICSIYVRQSNLVNWHATA